MADEKPPMPPQPTTKQLSAPDRAEQQFAELKVLFSSKMGEFDLKVSKGFQIVESKFDVLGAKVDRIEMNQDLQAGEIGIVKQQVGTLFTRTDSIERRMDKNSIRAKSLDERSSSADLEHEAKLAQTMTQLAAANKRCEELEKNAASKADVAAVLAENKAQTVLIKTVVDSPEAKKIGVAFAAFVLLVLQLATAYLVAKGHT